MPKYNKKYLLIYGLMAFIGAIINGYLTVNYGTLTDLAIAQDLDGIYKLSSIVLVTAMALMVSVWTQHRGLRLFFKQSMVELRVNYIERLFKRHRLMSDDAVYMSHLSNDADRLEQQYYMTLSSLVDIVAKISVSLFILVNISPAFIFVFLILALIFMILAKKTSDPVKKQESAKSIELEKYTSFVQETLNGFSVIKSHQIEEARAELFESSIEALRKQQFQLEKKTSLVDALNSAVQAMIIATLVVVGLYATKQAGISFGGTIVVFFLVSDILWPLQRITPLITQMHGIKSVFESYDKVLDAPEASGELNVENFQEFNFSDATLGYDQAILTHVNLSIKAGEKVLVVGPSGAGKSTVLKTIQRDINALEGYVSLNGEPLNAYDLDSYYSVLSIVDQIGYIFTGDVQENISMLDNGPVQSYLKELGLNHLEPSFKLVNNGRNVSGGERARLLLARALYYNKELIISDEILSSLDADIARSIELDMLNNAKTLINVSHIVFTDNLPLYDKFIIVDKGTASMTTDAQKVIDRMLETNVQFA